MNYKIEASDKVVIIRPLGDLNIFLTKDLIENIEKLQNEGKHFFIFDLEKSTWIDSQGIRCLLKASEKSKKNGLFTVIINMNDKIEKVLDTLEISKWVIKKGSKQEAIDYFEK